MINDIAVYVLTYNRAELLEKSLNSLVGQTLAPTKIIVLDNGSTDRTKEVVCSFRSHGIDYVGVDKGNQGSEFNYSRAIKMASTKYTMLFHDDDILHPMYFEYICESQKLFGDANVFCANGIFGDKQPDSWKIEPLKYRIGVQSTFARLLFSNEPIIFCSAIYNTDCMKKSAIQMDRFGKYADRPWMLSIVGGGKFVHIQNLCVFSRQHAGQDTKYRKNNPSLKQLFDLLLLYKTLLLNGKFVMEKIVYYNYNLFQLLALYRYGLREPISLMSYIKHANRSGVVSIFSIVSGLPYLLFKIPKKALKLGK